MNITKDSLYTKVLLGYITVLLVISCMGTILLHERFRLQEIDTDLMIIRNVQDTVNMAYQCIVDLAFEGETVIGWHEKEYMQYHMKRVYVDSLLESLYINHVGFMQPMRLDTLRQLLSDKEEYLFHIMRILQKQKEVDSLLIFQIPFAIKQATDIREIICKKKGLAGFFGKKETIRVFPKTDELYAINKQLISTLNERKYAFTIYTDSLTRKNMKLNLQFVELLITFNKQFKKVFISKEEQLSEMRRNSFRLIVCILVFAMLLLLISYLIIFQDIRKKIKQRQKMEKIIEENRLLLEMRKKIILTISHDVRGPLGSINNCAELAMDIHEKKKRNVYLENICISCQHILHLVNNLLDIYRMNENKETRRDVCFRLDQLLERVIMEYSQKSNDKGLLFIPQLLGVEIMVKGDADRIVQILDNLLINAIKFTEIGEICFIAVYEEGLLSIEIRDTGIGMTEETISRIFEPFERAAQAINSEGFGLGLSITKGLIGILDGDISVESSVGKGSVFCVTLPLAITDEKLEEGKLIKESLQLPRQVLVIDDDFVQLKVIKEVLERNGVICETCSNVKEVMQAYKKRDYDLVLTDLQMQGINGFSLLKLLRGSKIGNAWTVPIIAMTAHVDRDASDFTEAGFYGCIYKPFSAQELLLLISSVVQQEFEEKITVNFENLLSETNDRYKMLELLIGELEKSIVEIQTALKIIDRKQLCEIIHRMFPLWEILCIDKIIQKYRQLLYNENIDTKIVHKETERIVAYTREIIKKANDELAKLKYETEDIDS